MKKWMIRTVGLMLAGVCAFSLVGCGNKNEDSQEKAETVQTSDPKLLAKEQEKQRQKEEKQRRKAEKKRRNVYPKFSEIETADVGNYIHLGSYEQDGKTSNGKEKIEWRVLDKVDDKLFVQSEYILDMKPYNKTQIKVTWETCTLREWLNNKFYSEVFSDDEKKRIYTSYNTTNDHKEMLLYAEGGNPTLDKVFLISTEEAKKYYYEDEDLKEGGLASAAAFATKYAFKNGAVEYDEDHSGSSSWIFRSSDAHNEAVNGVNWYFIGVGSKVSVKDGIRPAMWITTKNEDVSNKVFNSADGTVVDDESGEGYQFSVSVTEYIPQGTTYREDALDWTQLTAENIKVGKTIKFGRYWQSDTNGDGIANKKDEKELIEWRILSYDKKSGELFLLAEKGLDCKPYHNTKKTVLWKDCSLRKWLNNYFYTEAFDSKEKSAITLSTILCEDEAAADKAFIDLDIELYDDEESDVSFLGDGYIETLNGKVGVEIQDKIFLLSEYTARDTQFKFKFSGESKDANRVCKATDFCAAQGAWMGVNEGREYNCYWWLRSPAMDTNNKKVEVVDVDGRYACMWGDGDVLNAEDNAVRPALRLSLK